ncbi:hypothetical protein K1719_037274 [Acacia pycnantha]|nr:hypothetical protein K1719_037274 [Acacia pycnantha]
MFQVQGHRERESYRGNYMNKKRHQSQFDGSLLAKLARWHFWYANTRAAISSGFTRNCVIPKLVDGDSKFSTFLSTYRPKSRSPTHAAIVNSLWIRH